jgi:hypothetical protein
MRNPDMYQRTLLRRHRRGELEPAVIGPAQRSLTVAQRRCGSGFSRNEALQTAPASQVTAASQRGRRPK